MMACRTVTDVQRQLHVRFIQSVMYLFLHKDGGTHVRAPCAPANDELHRSTALISTMSLIYRKCLVSFCMLAHLSFDC